MKKIISLIPEIKRNNDNLKGFMKFNLNKKVPGLD